MTRTAHLIIEHKAWKARYNAFVRRALSATLDHEVVEQAELSLLLTGDAHMRMLNHNFRGKDAATNVLSFPSYELPPPVGWRVGEGVSPSAEACCAAQNPSLILPPAGGGKLPVYLGDIAVSLDTVLREAETQGKSYEHHLSHLVVHSVLHLCGHDHVVDAEAEAMEAKEVEILEGLGIANPYL